MVNIEHIIGELKGKTNGNNSYLCKCPAHDDTNPSLSITQTQEGKILFKCHAGCSQNSVMDALKERNLWSERKPQKLCTQDFKYKNDWIKQILEGSVELSDSNAEAGRRYLNNRGLISSNPIGSLKYYKELMLRDKDQAVGKFPVLVGIITSLTNKTLAIHRTYITKDGSKANGSNSKKLLGSFKGGAIHFDEATETIALTEGLETGLAIREATNLPVWSCVSANGLKAVELPDNVKTVHIFADKDISKTGENAALALAERLYNKIKEIYIHVPPSEIPENTKSIDWLDIYNIEEAQYINDFVEKSTAWKPKKSSLALPKTFDLVKLNDLLNEPEEMIPWLVDGLLVAGGYSILAGKPKAGKTTLARYLAVCVGQGHNFLGMETVKGSVIYLALEEKRSEVKKHFNDMGVSGDEEIYIHVDSAPHNALDQIFIIAQDKKPRLIIIDPLFKFVRVTDGNDYVTISNALEPIISLARETNAHVLCLHHLGKGDRSNGDAILGSTAIFGAVDTAILLNRKDERRTIKTIQRYGEDLEESVLEFDSEKRIVSLGETKKGYEISKVEDSILEYLNIQKDPVTEKEIQEHIEAHKSVKVKSLRKLHANEKIIRNGTGKRNDPYLYSVSSSLVPTNIREPENQKANSYLTAGNLKNNAGSEEYDLFVSRSEEIENEIPF